MPTTITLGSTIDFPWGRNDGYRHTPDSIKINGQNVTDAFIAAHPDWNIQLPVFITQINAYIPGEAEGDTTILCSDLVKWNPTQETITFPTNDELIARTKKVVGNVIPSNTVMSLTCVISVRTTYVNPSGRSMWLTADYTFATSN